MSDTASIARTTMDKYVSAVRERDVAAFIGLYAPDVRIFDAWDCWEYRGTDQWRRPIGEWLSSHIAEKLTVTFDDVTVHGSAECAMVAALVTYSRVAADGALLGAIRNRLTWFLQIRDGVAQVVHEHTSVPVDFQKMQPLATKHS